MEAKKRDFESAYVSKHFLISDCSMTSFYAVSALFSPDSLTDRTNKKVRGPNSNLSGGI